MKIACILLLCGWRAAYPGKPVGRIAIRMIGSAHIPARTLANAKRLAGDILRGVGVEADWVDCDSAGRPCLQPVKPTDFWLQLLARRPQAVPGSLEPDATGYALVVPDCHDACGYAAVSYPAVRAAADEMHNDPALVLGAAIAHEIGHLLLGRDSHAPEGVMSRRLGPKQIVEAGRGTLRFLPDQAQQVRAEVLARMARASTSSEVK
jgi:hypothetical protein